MVNTDMTYENILGLCVCVCGASELNMALV